MASRIEVSGNLAERMKAFEDAVREGLEEAIAEELEETQKQAAQLAPVRTGRIRAALSSPEALRKSKPRNGIVRFEFGFITSALQKSAFHAYFVEFGTKGYSKGGIRRAGKTKSGKVRQQRIKRDIPPRPARPFFRPAMVSFFQRMRSRQHFNTIVAAAKVAAGFKGSDPQ